MEEVKFKEEYWGDAMTVLKREERKAALRKFAPLLLLLLLIVGTGSVYTVMHYGEENYAEEIKERGTNSQDFSRLEAQIVQNESMDERASANNIEEQTRNVQALKIEEFKTTNENKNSSSSSSQNLVTKGKKQTELNAPGQPDRVEHAQIENDNTDQAKLNEKTLRVADENTVDPEGTVTSVDKSIQDSQRAIKESILYHGNENVSLSNFEDEVAELRKLSSINRFSIGNKYSNHVIKERHYDVNRPFPIKVNSLNLVIGNSFFTGFGSPKGDLFFNPELGLSYENVFTEKWSASASLTYFQVSGVVHNAEFYQTQLDFGYHTTLTQVSTEKLHFAYLPLQATFSINNRNAITAGVGVSYLINSESIVTISEIDNFGEKELDKYSQWGYLDGYKPLNGSILLGYEFRLTPMLAFEVDYQYGLSKITRSNIYQQISEDRNSRLRVMFKYQIRAKA